MCIYFRLVRFRSHSMFLSMGKTLVTHPSIFHNTDASNHICISYVLYICLYSHISAWQGLKYLIRSKLVHCGMYSVHRTRTYIRTEEAIMIFLGHSILLKSATYFCKVFDNFFSLVSWLSINLTVLDGTHNNDRLNTKQRKMRKIKRKTNLFEMLSDVSVARTFRIEWQSRQRNRQHIVSMARKTIILI